MIPTVVSPDEVWVMSEKIHGANYSIIIYADGSVKSATRTAVIEDNVSFFNHVDVRSRYEDNLKLAFDIIQKFVDFKIWSIQFIWELFGGEYPGVKNDGSIKVQKWVFYTNINDYAMVDILVISEDGEIGKYLNYDEFYYIADGLNIPIAPILAYGKLEDLISIDVETFESVVPWLYNMPSIENNIAEGVVIKPKTNAYLPSWERVIIKKKSDKFKEVSREKKNPRPQQEMVEASPEFNELTTIIEDYLNENRVESAQSKFPQGMQYIGDIIGDFSKDVYEQVHLDLESKIFSLSEDERKLFRKYLGKRSTDYVKQILFKR